MQYMILNYVPAAKPEGYSPPAYHSDMAAWSAYTKAMIEAGVMRGGNALKPGLTATTVRLRDGCREVQDGPFADSKEELGGYYIIDVPDLDAALQWAARNPAAAYGASRCGPSRQFDRMQRRAPDSAVETEARQAYGRLVAILAGRSGDLAGAEDALADALVAALKRWPIDGTPANPQAWLLTVARRRSIDQARHRARADAAHAALAILHDEAEAAMNEAQAFPDARLGLLLACAHPAVDVAARTPLMLQAVLGLTAERMASAFLTSPAAMTKRLARAKAKIASSGVRFDLPGPEALPDRLAPLLEAIYAAFTLARDDSGAGALEGEAIWLARLLADLLPEAPEVAGLLSLMLFVASRGKARIGGGFTPLSQQDPAAWNLPLIREAEERLRAASRFHQPGRFQLEAAIQSVHADRRHTGRTDWQAILTLYDGLLNLAPTIGAQVARAAALTQSGDPVSALRELDALDPARIADHQPYWATRASALAASGNRADASDAYQRAAGLTDSPGIRAWLLEQRAALAD